MVICCLAKLIRYYIKNGVGIGGIKWIKFLLDTSLKKYPYLKYHNKNGNNTNSSKKKLLTLTKKKKKFCLGLEKKSDHQKYSCIKNVIVPPKNRFV